MIKNLFFASSPLRRVKIVSALIETRLGPKCTDSGLRFVVVRRNPPRICLLNPWSTFWRLGDACAL